MYISRWKLFGHREISMIISANLCVGVENFLCLPQTHPGEQKDMELYYMVYTCNSTNYTIFLSLCK